MIVATNVATSCDKCFYRRENIYTAKKVIETNNTNSSMEYGIDDDDFKKIMKILQNGRFK